MKKAIMFVLGIIICLSIFTGCTTKALTIKDSKINFENYCALITDIATKYNYEIKEVLDENIEDQDCYKDLILNGDDGSINIYMVNEAADRYEKSYESFSVVYIANENEEINVELCVELINSISGKRVSTTYCEVFLSAPESQYSAESYGFEKEGDLQTYKFKYLNMFEDWYISYKNTYDNIKELSFGGLTKEGTM